MNSALERLLITALAAFILVWLATFLPAPISTIVIIIIVVLAIFSLLPLLTAGGFRDRL